MYKSLVSGMVASALWLTNFAPATGQPVCRPKLSVTEVQFSKMKPPTLERKWTATVSVDAAHCAANSSGYFDLGISRLKENGTELEFREQFVWLAPSVKIGIDFWADLEGRVSTVAAVNRFWR
jgi:hypothetical protein